MRRFRLGLLYGSFVVAGGLLAAFRSLGLGLRLGRLGLRLLGLRFVVGSTTARGLLASSLVGLRVVRGLGRLVACSGIAARRLVCILRLVLIVALVLGVGVAGAAAATTTAATTTATRGTLGLLAVSRLVCLGRAAFGLVCRLGIFGRLVGLVVALRLGLIFLLRGVIATAAALLTLLGLALAVAGVALAATLTAIAITLAVGFFGGIVAAFGRLRLFFATVGKQAEQALDKAAGFALALRCCCRGCCRLLRLRLVFTHRCRSGRGDLFDRRLLHMRVTGGAQGRGFRFDLGDALEAGQGILVDVLAAHSLDLVFRRLQIGVRDQHDLDIVALLDVGNDLALFIQQVGADVDRQLGKHASGAFLEGFFLDDAQDRQRQRIHAADEAVAVATRADLVRGIAQ